ncbi:RNase adapter RapZ [Timonella senegalensis]|uniref:RNase adapter RapZ n=1 Tax=Timonella senegalensis TaxID=1465825 RepID=UPI0028AC3BF5|nr:RNase adapter RapZ [Timonella senegalensis]
MTIEPDPLTVPQGIPAVDQAAHTPKAQFSEVLIVTGMSGAGRSRAAAVLEDLDWYVVDNLPPKMLMPLVGMMTHAGSSIYRLAAVVDVRGREFFNDLYEVLQHFETVGVSYRIMFLDASDEVLVRRFEQVRRPHPLQADGGILDGITVERSLLTGLKSRADFVIDTSERNVHDLARVVRSTISDDHQDQLRINVMSFGFKYGIPLDADHVADMRFLANPFWIDELRHLTGRDEPVSDYVLSLPGAQQFIENYVKALQPVFAGYLNEEKRFATVAIGCTGGKHRSVAISEEIGKRLRALGFGVTVTARDLGKE